VTPWARKFALTVHLVFSLGWIGAAIAYLALGLSAVGSTGDPAIVRGCWIAMDLVGWLVIVPMALGALATGLVMALATPWGLLRHYWVLLSLGLTLVSAVVLLLHMPLVSAAAARAQTADAQELASLGGDLLHPAIGLVLLLVVAVLNVYKPRGTTRRGRRRPARGYAVSPV
jgi:hypothetical protein